MRPVDAINILESMGDDFDYPKLSRLRDACSRECHKAYGVAQDAAENGERRVYDRALALADEWSDLSARVQRILGVDHDFE